MACNNVSQLNFSIRDENVIGGLWGNVFGVLMVIIAVISTVENAIILAALCKYIILRRSGDNKILVSLICAYLLIGMIVSPLFSAQMLYEFSNGTEGRKQEGLVRKVRVYIGLISYGASVLTLAFLCLYRYLHLIRIDSYKMKRAMLNGCLIMSWLFPVILVVLTDVYSIFKVCKLGIVVIILLLIIVTFVSVVSISIALHRHTKHQANIAQRTHMAKERRSARTAVVMMIICFIMMIPFLVFYGTLLANKRTKLMSSRSYVFACLFLSLVSIINPAYLARRTFEIRRCILRMLKVSGIAKRASTLNNSSSTNDSELQISRENSGQLPEHLFRESVVKI